MLLKPDLGFKREIACRVCITFLHAWFTNKIIILKALKET
jgi:hypothetical protein